MKIRKSIIAGALALAAVGGGSFAAGAAVASGTTLQTVSQTEKLISAKCYQTHKVTTTYYRWSLTHYVLYPAPKRTVTDSTTCHK